MKHLKYSIDLTTQKNRAAVSSTQKIQIFEIQNPEKIPLIPVCKYAKFTPWGHRFFKSS